jgi:hypothetical protein
MNPNNAQNARPEPQDSIGWAQDPVAWLDPIRHKIDSRGSKAQDPEELQRSVRMAGSVRLAVRLAMRLAMR